jgi:hypothetical protein
MGIAKSSSVSLRYFDCGKGIAEKLTSFDAFTQIFNETADNEMMFPFYLKKVLQMKCLDMSLIILPRVAF